MGAAATFLVCALLQLSTSVGGYQHPPNPIVRLKQGFLRGRHVPPLVGCEFVSFQGIPYATPPIGALRFKDTQPPKKWSGVREADKEANVCPQLDPVLQEFLGDEDCLFLNVYTPFLTNGSKTAPVMVYFHAGGFTFGSGNAKIYGPNYFVDRGVVLVTINYRLGPFGFLHMGEAAPGNAGLKDQVMALIWVKNNIDIFGGDPNQVTIFGHGAGGASVHHHMLSPMSKGLFHRAIAQSGSVLNPWAHQDDPERTTLLLAGYVNCRDGDNTTIVQCIQHVDTEKIIKAAEKCAASEMNSKRLMYFPFVPGPETVIKNGNNFASVPFDRLVTTGKYHPVPFMTGFNSMEGLVVDVYSELKLQDPAVMQKVDADWKKVVLPELRRPVKVEKKEEALQALRNFFVDGQRLWQNTLPGYINMFSDLVFDEGILYSLKSMATVSTTPMYLYHFKIDDKLNFMKRLYNIQSPGACHADDIGYLFLVELRFSRRRSAEDDPPEKLRLKMVRLWTNFAKTGEPTPDDDETFDVKWMPYTEKSKNYMEIDQKLEPSVDLWAKNIQFWENFYTNFTM